MYSKYNFFFFPPRKFDIAIVLPNPPLPTALVCGLCFYGLCCHLRTFAPLLPCINKLCESFLGWPWIGLDRPTAMNTHQVFLIITASKYTYEKLK